MNPLVPVFRQIEQTLKSWIINKEFNPGEKIPSEHELAHKFNVNRLTIRHAISHLIQEGFLISKRGEGTFVTKNKDLINSFSLEFIGFMDDLYYQVSKSKTKSVRLSKITASKLIKEKLELNSDDEEVVEIKRLRFIEDRLFSFTINYLPLEIGNNITENDLYEKPLLQILEEDFSIQFTEALQTIEAIFANQEVAEQLKVPPGSPILLTERIMYTKKNKPVEIVQSFSRGDLFRYIVRFKSVKKKNLRTWMHKL